MPLVNDTMICSAQPAALWLFVIFIVIVCAVVGALTFYDLWLAQFVVPGDFKEDN